MPENTNAGRIAGPRLIALVGPFQSGKTTLLENLLVRSGALAREGSIKDGSSVGDSSPEARAHSMSVEPNIASADYLGDRFTFVDCPGSIEFLHDMRNVLPLCDAAIVVCEANPSKVPALQLILRELEDLGIPRLLFLNKIDTATQRVRETLQMLQPASRVPLLLRQIPIWHNGIATGFIDLALERAFLYREHAPSVVIDVPAGEVPREKEARYSMLERLADYDDSLMEELLTDIEPPRDQVFDDLARELREGLVVPVFIGSAERGNGVTRLLKALRHESASIAATRARLGIGDSGPALANSIRSVHTAHGGKLTLARVLRGSFVENTKVLSAGGHEDRIGSVSRMIGTAATRLPAAQEGDTLAFGRLDHVATGETFGDVKGPAPRPAVARAEPPQPVHGMVLTIRDHKDEVKLAAAMTKLTDEDPALHFVQDQTSGETRLMGQGEMHLRVALERLTKRFGVAVDTRRASVAYRETIRHQVSVRGRHKKQSGGHGQFGDVALTVRPLERGAGFQFAETVHGGTVPRQYFSAIEAGCRDVCEEGPLGFPVVDVHVTLTEGSYHTVDSSDMAFRMAARLGMHEALKTAGPVLLEPILSVKIHVPSEALSRATGIVTGRRGQILGYDARAGWAGWDELNALMPEAEMTNLIVDLRSASAGVAGYTSSFDHLAEISGKAAETIIAARAHAKAASGHGHGA
ncbi:MAG TPA: elongation factor G [Beijerinckiaceae bacterium]|nr:elongation factor G [Beijerinckiaceae bacterium]